VLAYSETAVFILFLKTYSAANSRSTPNVLNMTLESFLSLPLEEQIGQFFYIGLAGTEIDAETRALVEEVKPGGVIIFGRNVESAPQLRKLLDDVRELLPTDPLLGVDQE